MLERFAEQALKSYMMADPCSDHHLKLIQFNTINGFTRNAAALGYQFDWLVCAAISPFGCEEQSRNPVLGTAAVVPSSLAPTSMQLTTRHHPWLDLFPFPRIRDNLLIAASWLSPEDEQRLFDDIMEMGLEMESEIIGAEERQKGVQAMLETILVELDEVEGQLSVLTNDERTITHERIDTVRALTKVARSYNEK